MTVIDLFLIKKCHIRPIELQNHSFHQTEVTVNKPERTIITLLIGNIVFIRWTNHLRQV